MTKSLLKSLLAAPLLSMLNGVVANALSNPEEYVNTFGGTLSKVDVSRGNVLPEVVTPWGMNGWSPVTDGPGGSWFFYSETRRLYGVRCTHRGTVWGGDWGDARFSASVSDSARPSASQFSGYDPTQSEFRPYLFNSTLLAYGTAAGATTMQVTPTFHGAIMRFQFPRLDAGDLSSGYNQTRRILMAFDNGGKGLVLGSTADGTPTMVGVSTSSDGAVPAGFGHYYFSTILGGADGTVVLKPLGSGTTGGANPWGYLDFDATDPASDTLILRVSTSLISAAQAQVNHHAEVEGVSFDAALAAAKAEWNTELLRINIVDVGPGYTPQQTADWYTMFYSSLYRASKYPRVSYEMVDGKAMHWSPYTSEILPGVISEGMGFWDGYRTTFSLLALRRPDKWADMMEGFLNAYNEGGWIPQWSAPGYRGSMTGTMSDVSFSEAIVKLPHCGTARALAAGYCINATLAYTASRKNAFVPGSGLEGRACLAEYEQFGFVPHDSTCDAVVSRTLNYLHSDWALSQAAAALGLGAESALLLARSHNWTLLLEPTTAFLRPRNRDGSFLPTFDQYAWGPSDGYTESGPWQYRLEVPYDPMGLQAGLKAVGQDACAVVEAANSQPSVYHHGGYGGEIHEMVEMALNGLWGQWALNNQPVWAQQHMQVAFDTSVTGACASRAQYWLRRCNGLIHPGADMLPGDDDGGSMSAWFIFNMLGIYPLSPASGDYVIGSPLFAKVLIPLDGGSNITISALYQSPDNVYVQGVSWNGVPVAGVHVSYANLMEGGELQFTMGPNPASSSSKSS